MGWSGLLNVKSKCAILFSMLLIYVWQDMIMWICLNECGALGSIFVDCEKYMVLTI